MSVVRMERPFIHSARSMEVYKKAYALSLEIHEASLTFPKLEQFAIGDQIRRASKSICANLSEGFAKQSYSKIEFRRFVSMATGSAGEMETWIWYCFDLKYINEKQRIKWIEGYDHVLRMLIKLRQKLKT